MIIILDEHILYQSGSFYRVRRWLKGIHPDLGTIIWGLSGFETVQEIDVVKLMFQVTVVSLTPQTMVCPELPVPPLLLPDDLQQQPQQPHLRSNQAA